MLGAVSFADREIMSAVQKHGQRNAPGSSSDQPGIIDIEAMQVVMPLARAESWQPHPDLCPGVIDISDEESSANFADVVPVAGAARKSKKFGRCKICLLYTSPSPRDS